MEDICYTAPCGAATHNLGTDALSSLWRALLEQSGQAVTELQHQMMGCGSFYL